MTLRAGTLYAALTASPPKVSLRWTGKRLCRAGCAATTGCTDAGSAALGAEVVRMRAAATMAAARLAATARAGSPGLQASRRAVPR